MKVHDTVYETVSLKRENERPIETSITRSSWTWDTVDVAFRCNGVKTLFALSAEALQTLGLKCLFVAGLEYEKKEEEAEE